MSLSRYLCIFALLGSSVGVALPAHADSASSIERALSRGDISESEATLYRFYLMTGSEELPIQFAEESALRCGWSTLSAVADRIEEYPASVQRELESFSNRPSGLNASEDTEHFRVHYSTEDSRAPSGWPSRSYLDAVLAAVETCWTYAHEDEAWRVPPTDGTNGGGDDLIDLYISDLGSSLYGYAQPDVDSVQASESGHTAFFVIDNDYDGFGFANSHDAMKVTIAHEYHHVVQMGYQIGDSWWMENLSTFVEDEIYDDINDNYDYLPCFLSSPYARLDLHNGCHEYGGFLWPTFLSEYFGSDVLRAIEACSATRSLAGCFSSELEARGMDFDETLATFWKWNFYLSIHDDGNHYSEGSDYNRLMAYDRSFSSYPQNSIGPSDAKLPAPMSASVLRFNRSTSNASNVFHLEYDGPRCVKSVTLFQRFPDNVVIEHVLNLDDDGEALLDIERWDESLYAYLVTVVPRSCGEGRFDYTVNARTSTESTSIYPALYQRMVHLDQSAPNPFDSSTRIRYSLEQKGNVVLGIYDVSGRHVRHLIDADQPAGVFSAEWDGRDDSGELLKPGVYFSRIQLEGQTESQKIIFVER